MANIRTSFGARFDAYLTLADISQEALLAIIAAYDAAEKITVYAVNKANGAPANQLLYDLLKNDAEGAR